MLYFFFALAVKPSYVFLDMMVQSSVPASSAQMCVGSSVTHFIPGGHDGQPGAVLQRRNGT